MLSFWGLNSDTCGVGFGIAGIPGHRADSEIEVEVRAFLQSVPVLSTVLILAFLHGAIDAEAAEINWGTVGFAEQQTISTEANTYVPGSNPLSSPFFGLGGSTGGVANFQSQTFSSIAGTTVNLTFYYSANNWNGSSLEGPNLYGPSPPTSGGPNPDRRVTGAYAVRTTRDNTVTRTPVTVVYSFSMPVNVQEFIVGSLSQVSSSYENAIVRAFSTADATGPVVKATFFENISDLTDGSSLLHSQWDSLAPTTTNALSNVSVETGLTLDSGGVATNVGGNGDDGLYHSVGVGNQSNSRYGRVRLAWGGASIQSIAVSYWASPSISFTNFATTSQWISTVTGPITFSVVPEPGTLALLAIGGVAIGTASLRRRRRRA